MPKFTLQTYIYSDGVETPFIINGRYVWHLPGRNPLSSNTPAEGFEVSGSSLNIRVSSQMDPVMKQHIMNTSQSLTQAEKSIKDLTNFAIEKPLVIYDKNEVDVHYDGNLISNQSVSEDPRVNLRYFADRYSF